MSFGFCCVKVNKEKCELAEAFCSQNSIVIIAAKAFRECYWSVSNVCTAVSAFVRAVFYAVALVDAVENKCCYGVNIAPAMRVNCLFVPGLTKSYKGC